MKKITSTILLVSIVSLLCLSVVGAHGVDVTADKMIIASDSNGQDVKDFADNNNMNISVYKFTSNDEVNHQLEHMLNNSQKYIIVVDYQDVAHEFLNSHPEVKDRLIILDDVNDESLLNAIKSVQDVTQEENNNDFITPLIIGVFLGVILGVGFGVLIMKKKQ